MNGRRHSRFGIALVLGVAGSCLSLSLDLDHPLCFLLQGKSCRLLHGVYLDLSYLSLRGAFALVAGWVIVELVIRMMRRKQ